MRHLSILVAALAMLGCTSRPQVAEPLRFPAALAAECREPHRELETNQDLVELHLETRAALRECNGRLRALGREYGKGEVQ